MAISSAVDASAVARVVGIATNFKDLRGGNVVNLPQRIAVVGQGSTASVFSTVKAQYSSAFDVATAYGFGSPLHLAAKQLFPVNGDGVGSIPVTFYPTANGTTARVITVTPAGAGTGSGVFYVVVNNVRSAAIAVVTGTTIAQFTAAATAAIAAVLDLPVTAVDGATNVVITAKWRGASSNGVVVTIEGPTDVGFTFGIATTTPGAGNPTVDAALAQVGNVWESLFLNCLDVADTVALDAYSAFGEGRWGALVRKPCVVFSGAVPTSVANAIAIPEARKTDRTNCQLVSPGAVDLPFVVAARQLARIAVVANNNPPRDYGSQDATGLVPGLDSAQWTYPQRDQAVKGGSSTSEAKDGVLNIGDVVTFYHPTGNPNPAYRYVCDIVKLQQIIFNLDIRFATDEWDGAPLIPDDQPTANRSAKKPKTAVATVAALIDNLAINAIISDPKAAKASILAGINGSNPKRLDIAFTVQLSGNANIISIDLDFGFYFGTQPIVA
jgi:phage tail sheath gpL-like